MTSLEITRFMMEISDAVRLVTKATDYAQGDEIFILKIKTFKLGDLVEVVLDGITPRLKISREDTKVNVTSLVAGEKLHEDLINDTEPSRIYEWEDIHVVLPNDESSAR